MEENRKTESGLRRWLRFLVQFWREISRSEPCHFCAKPTRNCNIYGQYFHFDCLMDHRRKEREKKEQEESDRRQIQLYKIAIREVESEKLNAQVQATRTRDENE